MRLASRSEPRLAVIVMAAVSLSVIFAAVLLSAGLQTRLRDQALERSAAELEVQSRLLSSRVAAYLRLADALSRMPPLAGLQRSGATGVDLQDGSTRRQWIDRLATIFESTLRAERDVFQVRYIDGGPERREVVRLDRIDGELRRTPPEELQAKSARGYMLTAGARGAAPPFATPIEMNREHGAIDPRRIPTLRAVAPALDPDGRVQGWIVLNVDLRRTLLAISAAEAPASAPRIVDAQGRYAATLDPAREDAMAAETPGAAWKDLPGIAESLAEAAAFPPTYALEAAGRRTLVVAAPLRIADMAPPRDYMLAWERSSEPVEALMAAARRDALLAGLGATALAGALALALGRRLARPLRRLAAAGEAMTAGVDPEAVDWPAEGVQEVRLTAAAFREMAIRARDRQEELRAREARLAAVMDGAANGIVSIDARGRVRYANRALLEMFRYRREELLGRNVSILAPEPHRSAHDAYLRAYALTGAGRILGRSQEREAVRADGERFPVRLVVTAHRVDGEPTFTGQIADLSEERRTERMKAEFISTVSHELRTPLASIKGSLSLLRAGVAGELPEAATEMLDMAQANGERLIRLINDILDIEKIAAGGMPYDRRRLDLRALVEATVAETASMAAERGVRLVAEPAEPPGPAEALADPGRISQVLANLISNAIKHSDAGGAVRVSVAREDGAWRVAVADEGPGVPPHFRDRIFSRFAQADGSDSRARGGTGLGLSIARAIVEAHGGEIGFECPPGGGSIFAFRLPALDAEAEGQGAPAAPPQPAMIFARDPDHRAALVAAVEAMGLRPEPTDDAEAAIARLSRLDPAAVVLDGTAAGEDCRRIVEALRALDPGAAIPAILFAPAPLDPQAGGPALPRPVEVLEWPAGRVDPVRLRRAIADRLGEGARVLVVEDDDDQARLLARALEGVAATERAASCTAARAMLERSVYDAVILDLRMPDGRGESLVATIRSARPEAPLVLVYSVEEARAALRARVDAAFLKSAIDPSALTAALTRLLQRRAARRAGPPAPDRPLEEAADDRP
ncbi:ATP-binding protein [Albimonas sp. CAU 1670]|uniref:ATP-binding protein n=1 Tax=Albimonas sp. CAU 1670 TaxID=3032599 RepID=UPI0023DC9C44|nr:ATP-binding protein [Albimonas sp. CAU 1670]MDF2232381.1 ATP-binding protein [Albimonas sp. CAU 1670]